jgi:hypothetical protein
MSATLLRVETDLEFGVPVISDIILQDCDATQDGKTAIATGEEGDEIGVSVYGGKVVEFKGSYLYKGKDIAGIGVDVPSGIVTALSDETMKAVIYGFGRKKTHEGWTTGDYKGIGLLGAS